MSLEKIDALLRQLTEADQQYVILKGGAKVGYSTAAGAKEALDRWASEMEQAADGLTAELLDADKVLEALDVVKNGRAESALISAVGAIVKNCDQWLENEGVVLDYTIEHKLDKKVIETIEANISKLLKGWRR